MLTDVLFCPITVSAELRVTEQNRADGSSDVGSKHNGVRFGNDGDRK